MSDMIHHECGVTLIRLLKPLGHYKAKYGSARYGLHKLYQVMEKMINRGQDGAGVATIKLDAKPGTTYIDRMRSVESKATQDIFTRINNQFNHARQAHPDKYQDPEWQKANIPFLGELMLGHLRYGTFGKNGVQSCHPFKRQNNWMSRNLVVAGNFNLTNVDELFGHLIELGQHPVQRADTVTVMEKIGHFLDKENERLFRKYKEQDVKNFEISGLIHDNLDVASILRESSKKWDGGYVMCGLIGHGDSFVLRDPNGIRPAFYYKDDEVVVVASERPVIQTVFNVPSESVHEVKPGHAFIIKKNGTTSEEEIIAPEKRLSCSFERIYFSRANDADIYKERTRLGRNLTSAVLDAVDHDIENTVFSFIPNTAEIAFGGLVQGLHAYIDQWKEKQLLKPGGHTAEQLRQVLSVKPRVDKVVLKDAKQRTFITNDESRDSLVNLVYDITYGTVRRGTDTLVVLDDSIVRGTTLKQSILRILDRLGPKRIIVVSSAPQIRYPDCYGIDMAVIGRFVAFEAAMMLHRSTDHGKALVDELYREAKAELLKPKEEQYNVVQRIYAPFTDQQVSDQIAKMITPPDLKAEFRLVYQSLEGLHDACPDHRGDWYFSGDFPTPGGNKVSNQAFVNYMEGSTRRAY